MNRRDIELLDDVGALIDLELDLANGMMYWTDLCGTRRAARCKTGGAWTGRRVSSLRILSIVFTHLMEGIGLLWI